MAIGHLNQAWVMTDGNDASPAAAPETIEHPQNYFRRLTIEIGCDFIGQ